MWLWDFEQQYGVEADERDFPPLLRYRTLAERLKRRNVTTPYYYLALSQNLLNFGEQREASLQAVIQALTEGQNLTLQLLQDIKKGKVDIKDVVVSDDGWNIMLPEPEEVHSGSNGASPAVPAHVG